MQEIQWNRGEGERVWETCTGQRIAEGGERLILQADHGCEERRKYIVRSAEEVAGVDSLTEERVDDNEVRIHTLDIRDDAVDDSLENNVSASTRTERI